MNNKDILDMHVHISRQTSSDELSLFLKSTGINKANINDCTHSSCLTMLPKVLMMKNKEFGSYYAFSAPDVSAYYLNKNNLGSYFKDYFSLLYECGIDGIKLLEGKPQFRKMFPVCDFDDEVWEPFFAFVEEKGIPILWHVNDPEDFWDKENAPAFAIASGWLYGDDDINNEDQYRQVFNVLKRHPNIKICFAHFFFFSKQLDRLATIFDNYPNVYVDLTPGIEMYENFSNNYEASKQFFIKYQDRIIYGSDIGGRQVLGKAENKEFDYLENERRGKIVQYFLEADKEKLIESDGHYIINRPSFTMRPLNLDDSVLNKIYNGNIKKLVGTNPRPLNKEKIICYLDLLTKRMEDYAKVNTNFKPDFTLIENARLYFK